MQEGRRSVLCELNPGGGTWNDCMRRNIAALMNCDTAATPPGWEHSKGARLEVLIADSLSMTVVKAHDLVSMETISPTFCRKSIDGQGPLEPSDQLAKPDQKRNTMSKITVISGDFLAGDAEFQSGLFILKSAVKPSLEIKIPISKLETLETATEEIVNKKGSVIRWSLAGALLLGPVGLVAGWWLCDKEKEITFYAKFKDGRSLLATTDINTYSKFSASPRK